MSRQNQFIDGNLVRIRGRLGAVAPTVSQASSETPAAETPSAAAPPVEAAWEREHRQALLRRAEEFRALRRDVAARLTEKLAAIPEELRLEEERLAELREALSKFSALLDRLENIDDSTWDRRRDFGQELGVAMRQLEGTRLEYLRLNSKLAALQREAAAADSNVRTGASLAPELNSLTWRQGFRLGLCLGLPVILGVVLGAIIVSLTFILLWK